MEELYIGLMTGTSLDAIDVALANLTNDKIELIAGKNFSLPDETKQTIQSLCAPGANEIDRMGQVSAELAELYADAVNQFLNEQKISADQIKAIGSHGQTIRHRPTAKHPFTLQIGDPNIICSRTSITTIADFRSKDIALGGQGAPLAPAFHDALLKDRQQSHWVLNIGGIANLTYLPKNSSEKIIGFDTGPGNTLLDAWYQQFHKEHFDKDGEWAASGKIIDKLLQAMKAEPYFELIPPKSTGRELFNSEWLNKYINDKDYQNQDIQRTLLQLTVDSIADCIKNYSHDAKNLWLCGGGSHNKLLVKQLKSLLPELNIETTNGLGIHPDWIEATAFAWLAKQTLSGQPGNIPSVTGANKTAVLGTICLV